MGRLTEKTIGCFRYDLKDFNHKSKEFNDYDAFFAYNMAVKKLGELEDKLTLRKLEEWHEDIGDVVWWKIPIEEPPYVGSPLDSAWIEDYYTHFYELILPLESEGE